MDIMTHLRRGRQIIDQSARDGEKGGKKNTKKEKI